MEQGLTDEDWLPAIGEKGWVVFGRDQNILKRHLELQAFLKAKVHMFLALGDAARDHIIELVRLNLAQICARTSTPHPNVYWLRRTA
ncbi:hypothetical protein ACTMSW_29215 [Micromonospora sp. BQ11]|uniref:PIN-like domain-containing protein n=1 Tax=Micromonospora sp. BQ11 TaxID=3452212 RepID=UPI003F8CBA1E